MKVSAKDGYIRVDYGKKAGKATITCTVKGVKLKTTFTVKKYTNPVSSIKIEARIIHQALQRILTPILQRKYQRRH